MFVQVENQWISSASVFKTRLIIFGNLNPEEFFLKIVKINNFNVTDSLAENEALYISRNSLIACYRFKGTPVLLSQQLSCNISGMEVCTNCPSQLLSLRSRTLIVAHEEHSCSGCAWQDILLRNHA